MKKRTKKKTTVYIKRTKKPTKTIQRERQILAYIADNVITQFSQLVRQAVLDAYIRGNLHRPLSFKKTKGQTCTWTAYGI